MYQLCCPTPPHQAPTPSKILYVHACRDLAVAWAPPPQGDEAYAQAAARAGSAAALPLHRCLHVVGHVALNQLVRTIFDCCVCAWHVRGL